LYPASLVFMNYLRDNLMIEFLSLDWKLLVPSADHKFQCA